MLLISLGVADHNVQAINHYITYSIVTSTPAVSFTSCYSTVRLYEVTSGPHAGGTFVQWTANFSGDAGAGKARYVSLKTTLANVVADVVEDAKFKRREAIADLAKAATGSGQGKMT